ncbi:hypothetical protein QF046_002530 [Microbacterium sp. W4I4]|uniref:hypothetical protein n=1 Tax=Microbacterium sp. W4I4 TaxID=3042295 RepID=UPI0027881E4A|nr:hypothetical protein [Microbacterium sp. W4I4]MDQ0614889.1 hypothetical protein [Microbacterium sp. W4I4]
MTQQDVLFLVAVVIILTVLTLIVMQLLKPRKRDDRGEWYEGPWDDENRPRGPRN